MQSKLYRYDDKDINCQKLYEQASSLLYRGVHKLH